MVATLAALVTGGVYVSNQLIALPERTITLSWTNGAGNPADTPTEVWGSTNLQDWTLAASVPIITNRVTLPAVKSREFFKIRHARVVGSNTLASDWDRRKP
jgi:hypothetical protein